MSILMENLPITSTEAALLDAGPGNPFWMAGFHSKREPVLPTLGVIYTAVLHKEIQNGFTCLCKQNDEWLKCRNWLYYRNITK